MYKRFSVLVTQSQKRAHRLALSRLSKIAVIVFLRNKNKFEFFKILDALLATCLFDYLFDLLFIVSQITLFFSIVFINN